MAKGEAASPFGTGLSGDSAGGKWAQPQRKTSNKKEGRSIVHSPAGWYDNAPTLSHRGCAARKVVELRSTPRSLL